MTVSERTLVVSLLAAGHVLFAGCSSAHPSTDSTSVHFPPPAWMPRVPAPGDTIRVPVLVYHSIARHHAGQTGEQRELDVDTAVFRQQMSSLVEQRHQVVSFADLIDELEGRRELPEGAVVITFDDGWQDQYEDAFPILKQYGFTATFFVYTTAIGNGPGFMTWDELREMQNAGMTIGAHSRTHPVLTDRRVSLTDEIDGSRIDIEQNLGVAPDFFAYPYGDWDARVAGEVRAAGFRAARALGEGPLNTSGDVFWVRSVIATDDMKAFERALAGLVP
jgi:peptidoglycan/xylan/chitin deacetylase (PgdA/CDA1 family)